jgi:hypothetical protein
MRATQGPSERVREARATVKAGQRRASPQVPGAPQSRKPRCEFLYALEVEGPLRGPLSSDAPSAAAARARQRSRMLLPHPGAGNSVATAALWLLPSAGQCSASKSSRVGAPRRALRSSKRAAASGPSDPSPLGTNTAWLRISTLAVGKVVRLRVALSERARRNSRNHRASRDTRPLETPLAACATALAQLGLGALRSDPSWPGRKRGRRLCVCLPVIVGQRRGQPRCVAGFVPQPSVRRGVPSRGASPPRRIQPYAYPCR